MMLGGMIVPFVEGLIVNPETNRLKLTNGLGLVLLTFFLIFQVAGVKTAKATRKKFYALCVVMFFINGIVGVLTSLQSNPLPPAMTSEIYHIEKPVMMRFVRCHNWNSSPWQKVARSERLCAPDCACASSGCVWHDLLRGGRNRWVPSAGCKCKGPEYCTIPYCHGRNDCADSCCRVSILPGKAEPQKRDLSCRGISFYNFICVLREMPHILPAGALRRSRGRTARASQI